MWNHELSLPWWQALGALVLVALTTGMAVANVFRRDRPVDGFATAEQPGIQQAAAEVELDVTALTDGLIGAFDLATAAPAVRAHIQQVLRRTGVVPLDAVPGSPFDTAEHIAVDAEPAPEGLAGQVARQVRPGWSSHGTVLRPAEVVVWTS